MPSVQTLHPAPAAPALAVKLNPDVVLALLASQESAFQPKLVVKNGQYVCIT